MIAKYGTSDCRSIFLGGTGGGGFFRYGCNLIGENCGWGWLPTGVVGIDKLPFKRLISNICLTSSL